MIRISSAARTLRRENGLEIIAAIIGLEAYGSAARSWRASHVLTL
jgi:hypothetical protein